MTMSAAIIQERIQAKLPNAIVTVTSPDNIHYFAKVTDASFKGKSVLEQHRIVYATVQDLLANESIHALKLDTYTPE